LRALQRFPNSFGWLEIKEMLVVFLFTNIVCGWLNLSSGLVGDVLEKGDQISIPDPALSENNSYLFFPIIVEVLKATLHTAVAALYAANLFKHDSQKKKKKILLPEIFGQEETVHTYVVCNANRTNEQIIQTIEAKKGENVCETRFSNYVRITTAV
jgi:hypothetical protein